MHAPSTGINRFVVVLFIAALGVHFYLATRNWTAGFMPGHEFRQTHTAIISEYIDKENNFTPRYTVPLYGKPWVVPLEFPLYEWAVVGVSRALDVPHIVAARTVTLACFYAMLPAVFLLMGRLGLPRERRLYALVLVLCCPVYIFYSRAFLMESMVLMCAAWFLAGFVETMLRRSLPWLLVCAAGGAGAGLIKATTFFVWLVPAMAFGAWCLARSIRGPDRAREIPLTLAWGLGAAALPCLATVWWVNFSDAIKEPHPSAHIFASKALSGGNFGLYNLSARFDGRTWRLLLERWNEAIAWPAVIFAALAVGLLVAGGRRHRAIVAGAFALFIIGQSLFPYAYALQEYYFYASTVFLLVALGVGWGGLAEGSRLRVLRAAALLVLPGVLLANYDRMYRDLQLVKSDGGTSLMHAIRDVTPADSVIIVVGEDWRPSTAYYSKRKALMVRRGLEYDDAYLERAFNDLAGETVSALVMSDNHRENRQLARRIAERFNLDPDPTFAHPDANVYINLRFREYALVHLKGADGNKAAYANVEATGELVGPALASEGTVENAEVVRRAFPMVTPAPVRYRFERGFAVWPHEGGVVLDMHPDAAVWVAPPAGAREIRWEFGIFPAAYEREGDRTNGVEFTIAVESADGRRRTLFQRVLDPTNTRSDRGTQRVAIPCAVAENETLVFLTRPNGHDAFDWTYTRNIEVK
jgi:hypothetical protein